MPETTPPRAYEFGPFRFDVENRLLLRDGVVVSLKPKVVDTLLVLLERRGRVVLKEDLIRALWPDSFVEEANLTQNVYALRNGLGATDRRTAYIETIPRRGYRFVAEVREIGGAPARSLAVLPFKPLVAQASDESLELGIADALITALGQSRSLAVRPIGASRRYAAADQDPLIAARELSVDAVLDGSLQRDGDTIRVTARLIRAQDGATMWSGRYHEPMTGIFDLQDAIAEKISAALELHLGDAEKARLNKRYTTSPEAYRRYLDGRYNWSKPTEEGLWKAIDFFNQAIVLDPRYALAYVGVSDAYTSLDWYGVLSTRESNPQALAAAEQALAIDPQLAEAHASLALARQYRWDWAGAEAAFRRSLALNPAYAAARQWFALHLAFRGRFDEALAQMARAQEIDPMSLSIRAQQALILYLARRVDEAIRRCEETLAVEPAFNEARIYLALSLIATEAADRAVLELQRTESTPDVKAMTAMALAASGRGSEARAIVDGLLSQPRGTYVPHFWIAAACVALNEREKALERLERAADDPDDSCAGIAVAPFFDDIRSDPRFRAVVTRMGLEARGENVSPS